jgi:hypothetical protein
MHIFVERERERERERGHLGLTSNISFHAPIPEALSGIGRRSVCSSSYPVVFI